MQYVVIYERKKTKVTDSQVAVTQQGVRNNNKCLGSLYYRGPSFDSGTQKQKI